MAKVTISVVLGSGADDQATSGKFAVRRVEEGVDGTMLVLSDWKDYTLGVEATEIEVETGVLYESREVIPRGEGTRFWEGPATAMAYKDIPEVVPVFPTVGILGDDLVTGLAENPASDFNGVLTDMFNASEPGSAADSATAANVSGGPLTQAALAAEIVPTITSTVTDDLASGTGPIAAEVSAKVEALAPAAVRESALGQFELVPVFGYGDSWVASTTHGTPAARTLDRLGKRLLSSSTVNRGASSRTVTDVANYVLGGPYAWTPRMKGLVVVGPSNMLNDVKQLGTGTAAERGYKLALRSLMARLTANYACAANTAPFVYLNVATDWTTETTQTYTNPEGGTTPAVGTKVSTGGKLWKTTTVGAQAIINWTGDKADLRFVVPVTGGGVYTVTDHDTGTTLGSIDLSATVAQETPAVLRLTGLGSGTRTLRITLTSGAVMKLDSIDQPSTNPVPILGVLAPDVPVGGAGNTLPGGDPAASYQAAQAAARTWFATVAAEFPTVTVADLNTLGSFTVDHFDSDKRHLNDRGAAYATLVLVSVLADLPYSQGLNVLTSTGDQPAYVVPTPPAIPAGGGNGVGVVPYTGADYHWTGRTLVVGDTVTSWSDIKSGTVLASETGMEPVAAIDSALKYVHFDGIDDYLANTAATRAAIETIGMLVRWHAAPTADKRYVLSNGLTNLSTAGVNSGLTALTLTDGTTLTTSPAVAPVVGTWVPYIYVISAASSVISINGVETSGNAGGPSTKAGFRLARTYAASTAVASSTPLDIAEVIHLPNAADSTARTAMKAYLSALIA